MHRASRPRKSGGRFARTTAELAFFGRKQPRGPAPRPRQRRANGERPGRYFVVEELDLRAEMSRLRRLSVFAGGRLAHEEPELTVRRASRKPNRLGFAVPAEWRLSITAYPGARESDLLETLLHELVHLHVGAAAEAHRWHGATFKRTLAAAMREAHGVRGVDPDSIHHGRYAAAIERRRAIERQPTLF